MTKTIIGVVVITTATAYLLYLAIESSLTYCYTVDEFVGSSFYNIAQDEALMDDRKTDVNQTIRLAGLVKQGSIVTNAEKMQLDFELAGQKSDVPVRFQGVVPKNFAEGKEVFVEGRMDSNGVFKADRILTRCESKYKVKLQKKLSNPRNKPSSVKE